MGVDIVILAFIATIIGMVTFLYITKDKEFNLLTWGMVFIVLPLILYWIIFK